MRRPIVGILIVLAALMLIACSGTPPYDYCDWDAERQAKRELGRYVPGSIEVDNGLGAKSEIKRLSKVYELWSGEGYSIQSALVITVDDVFGRQKTFWADYKASVDTDGNCNNIEFTQVVEQD